MSTLSNDILAKVKALLALADNNTSAAEAALAAGRAQALLEKYYLTMADVQSHGQETPEEMADSLTGDRNGWKPILADAVAKANMCYGFTSAQGYRLLGRPSNVQIVVYFYAYLEREIQRLCKAAVLRGQLEDIDGTAPTEPGIASDQNARRAYCLGAASAVAGRLRAAREASRADPSTSAAIVRVDDEARALRTWARERYGLRDRKERGTTDRGAYAAGHSAGQGIALNKGLEGRTGRLLGPSKK